MDAFSFILLFSICFYICEAGVTEIPPDSEDETMIETVTDETWMPSNIFEVKTNVKNEIKINPAPLIEEAESDSSLFSADASSSVPSSSDAPWESDGSPIWGAIRDFIFQASDEALKEDETNDDPTEEIVKMLEKGLVEATTAFFNPPEEPVSTTASSENPPSNFSIVKIENIAPDSMQVDGIGINAVNFQEMPATRSVNNATVACSNCYDTLQTCVQMCFTKHNCNDVQRRARVCPPPSGRLCGLWGPVDECIVHEDCTSPHLCCSDGCVKKCTPGTWRN